MGEDGSEVLSGRCKLASDERNRHSDASYSNATYQLRLGLADSPVHHAASFSAVYTTGQLCDDICNGWSKAKLQFLTI